MVFVQLHIGEKRGNASLFRKAENGTGAAQDAASTQLGTSQKVCALQPSGSSGSAGTLSCLCGRG